jgi:hypothetical protein
MALGDLDAGLLWNIMKTVGESRAQRTPFFPMSTGELMQLVPAELGSGMARLNHLNRHVDYLREDGYLNTSPAGIYQNLRLTVKGQKFVQPELAEFGRHPMLPEVVKSLEDQIQILTYPPGEKEGLLFNLREAIARNAPEIIAKMLVEIGVSIARGGAR